MRLPMCLAAACLAVGAGAQERSWRAGVAAVDITPEPATGQWLAGLGDPEDQRVSVGAHDPIWCRALAVSDGETTVVFAVCDLIGLFYNDVEDIRAGVRQVPPGNVLIGATHVHSAPDTLGLWGPADDRSGVDPAFLARVKERATAAINQAIEGLEPVSLRLAETVSPPATSRNHNDPRIKDDTIAILQAVRPDGRVLATLTNWACHPEVLWTDNKEITSDYVHYLRQEVEAAQGGVVVAFNGALGGMVSPDDEGRHTFAEAERIGRAVGAAVNAALASATTAPPAPIRIARRPLRIPLENPGLQLLFQAGVIQRGPQAAADAVVTEVAAVQLGPSQWLTIPGEAFPAVGFLAKSMLDARYQFLLGLTLDELGYILPENATDLRKYRYERSMSVSPKAAGMILAALAECLAEIAPER